MSIRGAVLKCFTDVEVKSQTCGRTIVLLTVNLISLVIFGIIAFRLNNAYLLHGLDGSYIRTIVKQQSVWLGLWCGFTNNLFQSLGNVWFPLNTNLIPGYIVSLSLSGGLFNPIASYLLFSLEIFL